MGPNKQSFESGRSEETGDAETSKKKKKRVVRTGGILPKLEANKTDEAKPETRSMGDLFASKEKTSEKESEKEPAHEDGKGTSAAEIAAEDTSEAAEVETAEDTGDAQLAQTLAIPELDQSPRPAEAAADSDTLEGEFAEEGMIITRQEAPDPSEAAKQPSAAERPSAEMFKEPETDTPQAEEEARPEGGDGGLPPPPETGPSAGASPEEEPPRYTASSGSPPPEAPPVMYPFAAGEVPQAERQRMFNPSALPESRPVVPPAEVVPVQEARRQAHRAEKRGLSRGVLSGGVFGFLLGRRGRKTERAAAEQTATVQQKEIEQLKGEQALVAERLSALNRNQEALERQLTEAERQQQQPAAESAAAEAPSMPEARPPRPEQPPAAARPEAKALPVKPEDTPITEETYHQPRPGRRVEASAWHTYEVDEKTGQPVEKSDIVYGKEFKEEQKQERLRKDASQPGMAVQLGHAIVHGTSHAATQQGAGAPLADPVVPVRQQSKRRSAADPVYIRQQLVRYTTNPLIWVAAVLIVVLLLAIGVL